MELVSFLVELLIFGLSGSAACFFVAPPVELIKFPGTADVLVKGNFKLESIINLRAGEGRGMHSLAHLLFFTTDFFLVCFFLGAGVDTDINGDSLSAVSSGST